MTSGRNTNRFKSNGRFWTTVLLLAVLPSLTACVAGATQELAEGAVGDQKKRQAWLVRVSLPIGHQTVQQIEQVLSNLARQAPAVLKPEDRPVVILQFATDRGQYGAGSQLPDCMKLAQLLASEEMNRLQTVAWIPEQGGPPPISLPGADPSGTDQSVVPPGLYGHAVLVAMSADTIAMDPDMKIGNADIDSSKRDPLAIDIYRNLALQRLTIPVEVAVAMIDPNIELHAVKTADGEILVNAEKLAELSDAGAYSESKTLAETGRTSRLDAATLQRIAPNCRPVQGLAGLSSRYGVDLSRIEAETVPDRALIGVRQELIGYIDSQMADLAIRAIEQQVSKQNGANLVILSIDSPGGDLESCLKLARYVAGFQRDNVRTASWVDRQARGPAALVALACDHLLVTPETELGGAWEPGIDAARLEELQPDLVLLGEDSMRDPALLASMLDNEYEVNRYLNKRSGQIRWLTASGREEIADADQWQILGPAGTLDGLSAAQAEQDGIVRAIVGSAKEVDVYYQLNEPSLVLTPTKTDAFLLSFARFLANPMVSVWLMFLAFMLIMTELSQPGLGVPGFLGTLFIALYFWSHYLGGSAEWFEILLFVVGLFFILVELFLIPGFGVFGVTGFLMVVTSIVLAAQTFVIPRNNEELAQLPASLMMLVGAGGGLVGAMFLIRRILPNTPYFSRLVLQPPGSRSEFEANNEKDHRLPSVGTEGRSVTPLIPAGKARISGRVLDVITEGIAVGVDEKIEVVQASGNRIVVRPVDSRDSR